jgi:uncharacterized protein DUF955
MAAEKYRYGFKTEATGIASEVRAELKLGSLDCLDPSALAAHLDIPIWSLSEFVAAEPLIAPLLNHESGAFSAVTVFCGTRRTIVHNDGHSDGRKNNNLAHELAHGLLLHPPTPALDNNGWREWNQQIEDEATWLAGELLVTKEAAMAVARGQWAEGFAAAHLGVSVDLIRWRVNVSGARTIVQRAQAARARRGA